MLIGRSEECGRVDALLDQAARGRGGALAVCGEAGIGKTALLEYARRRVRGATVVAVTGVESELELPFAGLADVLRPLLRDLDALPESQQEHLRTALALGSPRPVDRFGVGAASLALLAAAANRCPVLVLVDDAQWLDAASRDALLFAARRLANDGVALVFAAREGEQVAFDPIGIEALVLTGLGREDAARLLDGVAVAPHVLYTLTELTRGNPLALLELPETLSERQLLGQAPLEEPLRVGARIQQAFARRAVGLGEPARRGLLVAAADDTRRLEVVEAAGSSLGASAADLRRAEDAGLLRLDGPRIEFHHPLVRAAVYQDAAPSERREAHRALAAALAGRDNFRHAWHAAAGATGYDRETAKALVAVAVEGRARGAYATAEAAFERAARLTDDDNDRPFLLADAAECAWLAGRTAHASSLIAEGLASGPEPPARAELLARRSQIGMFGDDQQEAYDSLLEAARLVEDEDPGRATELLALAMDAGVQLGGASAAEAAMRLEALRSDDDPIRALLVASALLGAASLTGRSRQRSVLERALAAVDTADVFDRSALQLLWVGRARFMVGHNDQAAKLARRSLDSARENGALALLPLALRLLAAADFDRGHWRTAYAAAGEAVELGRELEQHSTVCACLGLLAEMEAAGGNVESCHQSAAAAIEIATANGLGFYRERAERALGRLELACGRTADAIEILERVLARLERAGNREANVTPAWDLVEAHARSGNLPAASRVLTHAEKLMPPAMAGEQAVIERCRGIVAGDSSFRASFTQALALHETDHFPFERARTELVYGERLRRAGKVREARRQLRHALLVFDELGARAWATRARAELAASGERLRPAAAARDALTPRELQVALAVAEGASNQEVAATLYLTPKTVEYHLTRVYRKLGLRSRVELVRRFVRTD